MARVNRGERDWAYLDTLHRDSLDDLLRALGLVDAFDERARLDLVLAWHCLPGTMRFEGLARFSKSLPPDRAVEWWLRITGAPRKGCVAAVRLHPVAELVRAYKPDPRPYQAAAAWLDISPGDLMMVAAHRWDIDRAHRAGLRTAFVTRPYEKGPHGTADRAGDPTSDLAVASFDELADVLGC